MSGILTDKQIMQRGGVLLGVWLGEWRAYTFPLREGTSWRLIRLRRDGKKSPSSVRAAALNWNGDRFARSDLLDDLPQGLISWLTEELIKLSRRDQEKPQ